MISQQQNTCPLSSRANDVPSIPMDHSLSRHETHPITIDSVCLCHQVLREIFLFRRRGGRIEICPEMRPTLESLAAFLGARIMNQIVNSRWFPPTWSNSAIWWLTAEMRLLSSNCFVIFLVLL